jgi:4-hydroxy-tetrahydrodipicolinate synthase
MKSPPFRGTAPALVTPFSADGAVDGAAFRLLLDFVIDGGSDFAGVEAVVVLGTTGENPTVTHDERRRLVDLCIEHVDRRVPVVVGSGTNNTEQSVAFSKEATAAGADALLVVQPYYNKPTTAGFLAHCAAIADATDCPIILYNVPGRTGSNVPAEGTLRIAEEVPTCVAVKEASGNLNQIADIIAHRPEGFAVYSGDDDLTLPMLALGADGLISVVANAIPGPIAELVRAGLRGDFEQARDLHFTLLDAMRASFLEPNPVPVKAALASMGLMDAHVRLPLVALEAGNLARVLEAYRPFVEAAGARSEGLSG